MQRAGKRTDRSDDDRKTRRDFVKSAGRFAAYTPPAVMVLLAPSRDAIARSGGGGDDGSDDSSDGSSDSSS